MSAQPATRERPDLPDEPTERGTAVSLGKPNCWMRGVTPVTAWELTCRMERVTTTTASQLANRWVFGEDQLPAVPEDETAFHPEGLFKEAVQQFDPPPALNQDKLCKFMCLVTMQTCLCRTHLSLWKLRLA